MARATFIMTEHPGWADTALGLERVFCFPSGARSLVRVEAGRSAVYPLSNESGEVALDTFHRPGGRKVVPELRTALDKLGTVARFRNPSLWDAIGTAILRQVIRARQSKKMYRSFCGAYGQPVPEATGPGFVFPSPEVVLRLTDGEYSSLGMAFKREPLRAAARAYLTHGERWQRMAPSRLVEALQEIPRVGPWTARAAVADWSNDWSQYPYSDLAVRTWAKRAVPGYRWPVGEGPFGDLWRSLGGNDLSALTLLILAWGSQYGDIG